MWVDRINTVRMGDSLLQVTRGAKLRQRQPELGLSRPEFWITGICSGSPCARNTTLHMNLIFIQHSLYTLLLWFYCQHYLDQTNVFVINFPRTNQGLKEAQINSYQERGTLLACIDFPCSRMDPLVHFERSVSLWDFEMYVSKWRITKHEILQSSLNKYPAIYFPFCLFPVRLKLKNFFHIFPVVVISPILFLSELNCLKKIPNYSTQLL
jgi:hypothetical protein